MTTKNIFIIDSRVADYQSLITGLPADSEVYVLDPGQDGIAQMQAIFANYSELDSIQIISHGAQGALYLGNTLLNSGNIDNYRSQLGDIGVSLTATGDLLLYGCNVAQGDQGRQFIEHLAQFTGAEVAASEDWTGNAALGGNWKLEAETGAIEKASQALVYEGVLGPLIVSVNAQIFNGHTFAEFRNQEAFAALKSDGSVITWGSVGFGGDSSGVAIELNGTIDIKQIYSSFSAFAALRADGSVVTWGDLSSSNVADKLDGTIGVEKIYSARYAFAALRADGSVVTWGSASLGGDSSSVANELVNVKQIYSTNFAFAALRTDGSVVTWGDSVPGGDSSSVADKLDGTVAVEKIYSTGHAFAALRVDGSVVAWGWSPAGGNSIHVANLLDGSIDVKQVFSSYWAFAALRADGSVVTWGLGTDGGDSSSVASKLDGTVDVLKIYSTDGAFVALRADGSVVTWGNPSGGGDSSSVADKLDGTIGVENIYSSGHAFAALRADGSVVTWGSASSGGDSSSVANELVNVKQIYSSGLAFAALRADGSVVTWGDSASGGDSSSVATALDGTVDVTQIYTTYYSFAALRADGSVITWGDAARGGDSSAVASQLSSGVVGLADIYTDDVYTADTGWQITPNAPLVSETDGTIEFTVTRPNDRTGTAETVYVSTTQNHGSVNTNDYGGLLNIPYSFAVGEVSRTVTVDILADSVTEPDETFGLIVQTSSTDPITNNLASTTFTITENVIPPSNLPPAAQPVSSTKNLQPGQSIPLSELFTWNDPNGEADILEFSVVDQSVGGGYLTLNEEPVTQAEGTTITNIPLSQIDRWAFISGADGEFDNIGFAVTDSQGNTSDAVVAFVESNEQSVEPKSASTLELEYFARRTAYGEGSIPFVVGAKAEGIALLDGWSVSKTWNGLTFHAIALEKAGHYPVLAIRGTVFDDPFDWLMNTPVPGVGSVEAALNWGGSDGIRAWLAANPLASITGHSQGGSIAMNFSQRAETEGLLVDQLVTFNAAGIDLDDGVGKGPESVLHYVSYGDFISLAGEGFISGDVVLYDLDSGIEDLSPIGFIKDVHTGHWAQTELYSAVSDFGPTEVVRLQSLSTTDLNQPFFTYDTVYPGFDNEPSQFLDRLWTPLSLALQHREAVENARTGNLFQTTVPLLLNAWKAAQITHSIGSVIQDGIVVGSSAVLDWAVSIATTPTPIVSNDGTYAGSTPAVVRNTATNTSETLYSAAPSTMFLLTDPKTTIQQNGGNNVTWGLPENIDGLKFVVPSSELKFESLLRTTISTEPTESAPSAFTTTDALFIYGVSFGDENIEREVGSAILRIDFDGNGLSDATVTMEGNYRLASFVTEAAEDGTYIRYLGNAAPEVVVDSFATSESLPITTGNVLLNDTDGDDDALSVTGLDLSETQGVVTDNGDGTFNYDPNGAFDYLNVGESASDSFTYTASDGNGGNDTATVTITINGVSPPIANDDSGVVNEDSSLILSFAQLLANDSHVDSAHDTIVAVDTFGTAGSVVIDTANQTVTYRANADQFDLLANGATVLDSFKYILQGNSGEISASVAISVTGVNDGKSLFGTVRRDILNGTTGEDVIKGNNSNDIINGRDGADRLFGENGDDKLDGGNSIDSLSGGTGNDWLKGGYGDDSLIGGDGNDRLEGGMGNDWLKGEKGTDLLIGGAGSDIFAFAKAGGKDIVTDFIDGVDKIQIAKNTGVTHFSQLNITSKTEFGDALYTAIEWGSSDKILLVGVSSGQLDAADFNFSAI